MTNMLVMLASFVALTARCGANVISADYAGLFQLIQPAEKL